MLAVFAAGGAVAARARSCWGTGTCCCAVAHAPSTIAPLPMETMERLPEGPWEKRIAALDFFVDLRSPSRRWPHLHLRPYPPATVKSAEPWLTPENALLLLVLSRGRGPALASGAAWRWASHSGLRLRRQSEVFLVPNAPCELAPVAGNPSTRHLRHFPQPHDRVAASGARLERGAACRRAGASKPLHVHRHDIACTEPGAAGLRCLQFNPPSWLAAWRALRREAEFAATMRCWPAA